MIIEKAYAKINLTLDVKGKMNNGYHELDSIMCPLELHDILKFEPHSDIILEEDEPIEDNIILKTAYLLKDKYSVDQGAKITLVKNIPIQAGLAGGSADSSATLRGLNRLWGLNLSLNELKVISEELGSDNSFCIYNRIANVFGRGEVLEFLDYELDSYVLLIKPNYGASTKQIFSNHIINYDSKNKDRFLSGINKNDLSDIVYNDLEVTTMRLIPELRTLKEKIQERGFRVLMSGSGPTLYVLSKHKNRLENLAEFIKEGNRYILTNLKKTDKN